MRNIFSRISLGINPSNFNDWFKLNISSVLDQPAQNAALQAEKDQAAQALQTKSLAAQYQREILGQQGGYGSTSGTGTNPWAGLANEPGETAVLYGAGGTGDGGYAGYDYGNLQPDNQFYTYSNTGD